MSLIETYESRKELIADNLNTMGVSEASATDGLTTLANMILDISVSKTNTILTLNTPLVVYTDLFTVTGTLTDDEETPIAGATVQLVWNDGTEHIATGVTNSSGVFSFTSTDPASVSAYSFQLFFAGDTDYNASNSSVVNVNTAKETSVMVITSPASGSTVSSDSVTVTGTLKDNDGTAMGGKSVSFSLNSSSAGTATVGSDGSFNKTVTGLIAGSNSITVSFTATTTHTAANQSITVNRVTFDSLADIELIDGSQILSYADEQSTPNSQYATLETQLMNGQSAAAISGVSVGFYDYSDENNPVLLGSDDTDSSGKASFTYHSLGVGDVPIKAVVGSLLTKTFSIQDYHFYDPLTSDSGHWNWDSTTTHTYSSNGVNFKMSSSGNVNTFNTCKIDLPSEFEAEITYMGGKAYTVETVVGGMGWTYDVANNRSWGYYRTTPDNTQDQHNEIINGTVSGGDVFKFVRQNGTLKIYVNDVEKWSYTAPTPLYNKIVFQTYSNSRNTTLKDLKVKPL